MIKKSVDRDTAQYLIFKEAENLMLRDGVNTNKIEDFQREKYWWQVSIPYIQNNPYLFVKFYTLAIIHSLINLETNMYSSMLGMKSTVVKMKNYANLLDFVKTFIQKKSTHEIVIGIIMVSFLMISYLLLIIGFSLSWRRYSWPFLSSCALMASYFILISGAAGLARFRMPSTPFYLVFIGVGFDYIIEKVKHKNIPNDTSR